MSRTARHWLLAAAGMIVLSSCNTTPPAPVEDRGDAARAYQVTRDGHYRVRRGDSLHSIAFKYGLDWRDIAGWNDISSPYTIYPDQQLQISPPPNASARTVNADKPQSTIQTAAAAKVQTSGKPTPAPARTETAPVKATTSGASRSPESRPPPTTAAEPAAVKSVPTVTGKDPSNWLWPTRGRVVSTFRADDPARKGVDISGTRGQPVMSSASGQVVYSGNGLIGYGELIIIKHSERMLSAYAHNSKRLVSEGEQVSAGQHIAAMGTDERKDAVLHFEIRVNGKPSDPLKFLSKQ